METRSRPDRALASAGRPAVRAALPTWPLLLAATMLLLAWASGGAYSEDAPGVLVRGRLAVRDSTEIPKRFVFQLRLRGDAEIVVDGKGQDGRFELRVPRAGTYIVGDMKIDDEPCRSRIPNVEVSAGHDVEIVVDPLAAAVLLVTDVLTGRPIAGARAYRSSPLELLILDAVTGEELKPKFDPYQIPGEAMLAGEPRLTDESGMVVLPRVRGPQEVFVVATGHAWTALQVPAAPSAPVPVALRPGGTLALQVAGWSRLLRPALTLRDASGREVWVPAPDAAGSLRVEGLAVGSYVVTVHCRGSPSSRVYAEARFEIAAGRETTARIDAERVPMGQVASFSGVLTVPASWKAQRVDLEFAGADQETAGMYAHAELGEFKPGVPMRFPATAALACGMYVATVSPLSYHQRVELVPGGGHVEIVLPDPVEVRLHLLDDRSGREITEAHVSWHCPLRRSDGGFATTTRFDAERRMIWFLAPPHGLLQVTPYADGYFPREVQIDLPGTGVVEREIRLRSEGVVIVRLQLDGKPFVNRRDVPVVLLSARDPFGEPLTGLIQEGHAWIEGLTPGTYSMAVGAVPADGIAAEGFARIPRRAVEVKAGSVTEVLVELQRAK